MTKQLHKLYARISKSFRSPDSASREPALLRQMRSLMDARDVTSRSNGGASVRVGIASFGAGTGHITIDCLLADALAMRGATCQLLLCDMPMLPGCDERNVNDEGNDRCVGCIAAKLPYLETAGVDWVGLRDHLPDPAATLAMAEATVAACPDEALTQFQYDEWEIGAWLGSSVASFLRSDSHGMSPEVVDARRRYLISGIVALIAAGAWLDAWQPDIVLAISGRHIFWRAVREIAQARGIKVVCREMFDESFDRHIYAVNSTCEDPALPQAWAEARGTPLTESQNEQVDRFLMGLPAFARQSGSDPVLETRAAVEIRTQLALEPDRNLIVLFTNVSWDLFVAERDSAFDGQMEWIAATFEFLRQHPEVDLVVRAHPAEIVPKFRTRGRIIDQITNTFSPLPANLRLVGPESDISSDALRGMASLNLVYCASVGLEATIAGQPVLVCGKPYYSAKGFTIDVQSREQYRELLERHVAGHTPIPPVESADLARRFLYMIKFRYGIRMGLTTDDVGNVGLTISRLDELEPGRSSSLDTVCNGILHDDEILLPA